MVTDITCEKKEMLLVNYEAPNGEKRHNRLWNGGNGQGTVKLYCGGTLLDEIIVRNAGCEYGEYDPLRYIDVPVCSLQYLQVFFNSQLSDDDKKHNGKVVFLFLPADFERRENDKKLVCIDTITQETCYVKNIITSFL